MDNVAFLAKPAYLSNNSVIPDAFRHFRFDLLLRPTMPAKIFREMVDDTFGCANYRVRLMRCETVVNLWNGGKWAAFTWQVDSGGNNNKKKTRKIFTGAHPMADPTINHKYARFRSIWFESICYGRTHFLHLSFAMHFLWVLFIVIMNSWQKWGILHGFFSFCLFYFNSVVMSVMWFIGDGAEVINFGTDDLYRNNLQSKCRTRLLKSLKN